MRPSPILPLVLGLVATVAHGQQQARIVKYHANDIVSVRAKMRYTTLIQLPPTEKILEVATGDKDFWVVDVVGASVVGIVIFLRWWGKACPCGMPRAGCEFLAGSIRRRPRA